MTILRLENGKLIPRVSRHQETITLEEWQNGAGGDVLVIENDVDINTIGALTNIREVVLEFPNFADGRAYSQARLLRERKGFTGRIRAVGDVLCDQIQFMIRVGFDEFDIGDGDQEGFQRAVAPFSIFYQHAVDRHEPVWAVRIRCAEAA